MNKKKNRRMKRFLAMLLICLIVVEQYTVSVKAVEKNNTLMMRESNKDLEHSTEKNLNAADEKIDSESVSKEVEKVLEMEKVPETEMVPETEKVPSTEVLAASAIQEISIQKETEAVKDQSTEDILTEAQIETWEKPDPQSILPNKEESTLEDLVRKEASVIKVSDLASFAQAVSEVSFNDDLEPEYGFTVDEAAAVIEGEAVELSDASFKENGTCYVPADTFAKDESINQESLATDGTVSLDAVAENSDYLINTNGDLVELKSAFVNKRLIVTSDNGFDTYGALTIIQGYNDIYVLSYASETETKVAYESLQLSADIKTVEVDSIVDVAGEEAIEGDVAEGDAAGEVEKSGTDTSLENLDAVFCDSSSMNGYLNSIINKDTAVTVAILDTGFSESSERLRNRVVPGYNYAVSGAETGTADDNGHGTMVAGLIAENTPENVKLESIKIANSNGKATQTALYMGIEAAIASGADVINISMNSYANSSSAIVDTAINKAYDAGIAVVASAGNAGKDVKYYSPSNVDKAIVVGSVDTESTKADFSNFGVTLDYVSDGVGIKVTGLDGQEQTVSGTSYSAAFVSAMAANMKTADKGWNADKISGTLAGYAADLGEAGRDNDYGSGYVSLHNDRADVERPQKLPEFNKTGRTILDVEDWRSLSDKELFEVFRATTNIELAYFLQNNQDSLEELLARLPYLNYVTNYITYDETGNPLTGTQEEVTYKYLLGLDTSEFSVSGTDISGLQGHFYYYLEASDIGAGRSNYIVNISNDNGKKTFSYSVTPTDTDNYGLRLNGDGRGERKAGSQSESTNNEVTQYSVFCLPMTYTRPRYHSAVSHATNYAEGYRFNTKNYDTGTETLGDGTVTVDENKNFIIAINAVNCGIGISYNKVGKKYEWGANPNNVNGTGGIHLARYVAAAYCDDFYSDGRYIGRQSEVKQRTYPSTTIGGGAWGWESDRPGYYISNDTTDDYLTHSNGFGPLSVARIFSPITYTVRYNKNDEKAAGTTDDSVHTYDAAKNLNDSKFEKKYSVQFNGNGGKADGTETDIIRTSNPLILNWNTAPNGSASRYELGQEVKNLTTTKDDLINLYAQWEDKTMTLPTGSRVGYDFLGWSGNLASKEPDSGMNAGSTIMVSSDMNLYAVWEPHIYTITLDNQGANLKPGSSNVYEKYTVDYFNNKKATSIFANDKIVLPEKYTDDSSLFGKRRMMQFLGYYTGANGAGDALVKKDGSLIPGMGGNPNYTFFTNDATVYAHWIPKNAVQFSDNLTDTDHNIVGNDENNLPETKWKNKGEDITVNFETASLVNHNFAQIYRMKGWSLTPEIGSDDEIVLSEDKTSYTFSADEDVILYAQWDTSFNVTYVGNTQSEGTDYLDGVASVRDDYTFTPGDKEGVAALEKPGADYFVKTIKKPTVDMETGEAQDESGNAYTETILCSFQGWSMVNDKHDQEKRIVYQQEEGANKSNKIILDAEAVAAEGKGKGLTFGEPITDYGSYNAAHSKVNSLMGINKGKAVKKYTLEEVAKSYAANIEKTPFVNMYAIWDQFPQIDVADMYFPLADAQDGILTEEFLLNEAEATDEELKSASNIEGILKNGADGENNTSFTIQDYQQSDFAGAGGNTDMTITYWAEDSVGNVTTKTVHVHLVDTIAQKFDAGSVRFISKEYADTLNEDSIWRSGEFATKLAGVLGNSRSGEEYTTVSTAEKAFGAKPVLKPGSGDWSHVKQVWEFTHEQVQEVQEYVKDNGIMGSQEGFLTQFGSCRVK